MGFYNFEGEIRPEGRVVVVIPIQTMGFYNPTVL